MFKLSSRSVSRMDGIHPDLILIVEESIKITPIDFGIPRDGGIRTAGRQLELHLEGKSKCDGVISKSNHQSGNAVDFYAYINGKASWEKHHLSMVYAVMHVVAQRLLEEGAISKGIRWGGSFGSKNFNGYDMPHIELH